MNSSSSAILNHNVDNKLPEWREIVDRQKLDIQK